MRGDDVTDDDQGVTEVEVTTSADTGSDQQTAFAAGVAAATAVQASREADEAVTVAETAAGTAEVAATRADEAAGVAYDARSDVEALRTELREQLAAVGEALRALAPQPTTAGDEDEEPAPEPRRRKAPKPEGEGSAPPPAAPPEQRYGSRLWFG